MYKQNDYITLNQYDENQVIWRYMNFEKFISLLQNKALFFSTCFNMQKLDPFEGYYPKINLEKLEETKEANNNFTENEIGKPKEYRELFLKNTFINCWHVDTKENAAMWKIYTSGENGLVIKSSISKLKKSFERTNDDIYIGNIEYLDYESDEIKFRYNNYISDVCQLAQQENYQQLSNRTIINELEKYYNFLILSKRKEYKFENEIRAVSPFCNNNIQNCIKSYGKFIKVNINTLIDEIIINPSADDSFVDIVKNAVNSYIKNFDCAKIYKSKLYEKYNN